MEGLSSYAQSQKDVQQSLKVKFETLWKTPLEEMEAMLADLDLAEDHEDNREEHSDNDLDSNEESNKGESVIV